MDSISTEVTGMLKPEYGMESSLAVLTSLAKRPEIDIKFEKLTYTVNGDKKDEKKEILREVSGEFHTGQLTAILGPSGAGKSSLMNILVGYRSIGVDGNVLVNGKPRDVRLFHKLSCYIMQEDVLHSGLTVEEAMNVAAELKLGIELKPQEKKLVIKEVLDTLGLEMCRNVKTENLSGGQRKRLCIALELVNNPPIIFLDEPTSGLDIVSTINCINLLKHLAHCGRTIICTIHQPSASILSIFDNIYVIANGKCAYQGSPECLVPFLKKAGFDCPLTYNPADFIMEIMQSDSNHINTLSIAIENGNVTENDGNTDGNRIQKNDDDNSWKIIGKHTFASSFYTQFSVLLKRMTLKQCRNKTSLAIMLLHYILNTFFICGLYYNVGNNGTSANANIKYCVNILVLFVYSNLMIPVIQFPTEFRILRREYFNRWYGLKAYFIALTIANIPLMIFLGLIILGLTYYMSGQILELDRFILFSLMSLLTGYCSEGLGFLVGSIFNVQNGSIVACGTVSPLLGLCFYGLGFGPKIETSMKILMSFSYLRYAIVGTSVALYENRPTMNCEETVYCHYGDPKVLMRDLGMENATYVIQVLGLLVFTILFRAMSYVVLRIRLKKEFSNKYMTYFAQYLRKK